jgi:hypothetical protein
VKSSPGGFLALAPIGVVTATSTVPSDPAGEVVVISVEESTV